MLNLHYDLFSEELLQNMLTAKIKGYFKFL
jgi:hypothetical protein